jgi:hypothetical protein
MEKIHDQVNDLQLDKRYSESIVLLQKLLAFVQNQLGVQIKDKPYYRRIDGDEVDNFFVICLLNTMVELCRLNGDMDSVFTYATEAREMLERRDKLDDQTLKLLSDIELHIASINVIRNNYAKAEHHCEQCLMFARLIKGEGQISKEYKALMNFSDLRGQQYRGSEAIELSEKAYILVSNAYGPVHPDVQAAAATLIDHLIKQGDYHRADNYCRMNYENLIDPSSGLSQDSVEVAGAKRQLVDIWLIKPPPDDVKAAFALAEEAEQMIRQACGAMEGRFGVKSFATVRFYELYCNLLLKREIFTPAARNVLVHSLALHQMHSAKFGTSPRQSEEYLKCFDYNVKMAVPTKVSKKTE